MDTPTENIIPTPTPTENVVHTPTPISGEFIQKTAIAFYDYFVGSLVPHQSVTLGIRLIDGSGNEVYRYFIDVVGEEYAKWGEDDSYLDTIVYDSVNSMLSGTPPLIPPRP